MGGGSLVLLSLCTYLCCRRRCKSSAKVVPDQLEGQKIFGSYKQNDGSDALLMNMFHAFEKQKVDFWLDKMRGKERSEEGMVAGVIACNCFCAVISPAYFTSAFCKLELNTAMKHEKQIAVCFNGSKFQVQEALAWIPKEYAWLMNDELIKLDEDNEFMEVSLKKLNDRLLNPTSPKKPKRAKTAYKKALMKTALMKTSGSGLKYEVDKKGVQGMCAKAEDGKTLVTTFDSSRPLIGHDDSSQPSDPHAMEIAPKTPSPATAIREEAGGDLDENLEVVDA